jgi:hypothetical protein
MAEVKIREGTPPIIEYWRNPGVMVAALRLELEQYPRGQTIDVETIRTDGQTHKATVQA